MLAVALGTLEQLLIGLTWAWESFASNDKPPEQVVDVNAVFQEARIPVADTSVAAPAVSNILATSAAVAASATVAQRRNGRRITPDEIETLASPMISEQLPTTGNTEFAAAPRGDKGGAFADGIHTPEKTTKSGSRAVAYDMHNSAQVRNNERKVTLDNVYSSAYSKSGAPPPQRKSHKIVETEPSAPSIGDVPIPPAQPKHPKVANARGKFNTASVAARQQ